MIKQTDNSDIRKTLRMKRFFFDSSRQKTFQDIFKCSWLKRASLNSLGGSTIEKQQLWSRYSSFPNGSRYIYLVSIDMSSKGVFFKFTKRIRLDFTYYALHPFWGYKNIQGTHLCTLQPVFYSLDELKPNT